MPLLIAGSCINATTPILIIELDAQRVSGLSSITTEASKAEAIRFSFRYQLSAYHPEDAVTKAGGRHRDSSRNMAQHRISRRRASATIAIFFRAGLPLRTCS